MPYGVGLIRCPGGYVFITNMIPLHALVLILMGRFSNRLYIAYSTWYAVGTLASMQVPFVGFQPVSTSEHMAALGNTFRPRFLYVY
jgi:dolichyl-diphosphooligosaccharide---protein glycosyltransferase